MTPACASRRKRAFVCVLAATVVLAACSGEGDDISAADDAASDPATEGEPATETSAAAYYEAWPGGPTPEDYSAVPPEVVVRELLRPGEVPEPPTISVFSEGSMIELQIWTTCWLAFIASDGAEERYCSDGWRGPNDELQRVRGAGPLYVEFPLAGWEFGATTVPISEEECGRFQSAWLVRIAPTVHELVSQGFADTYIVDVYGRGPGGDVASSFVWETTVDGVLPVPRASMGLLWEDDGRVTSHTAGLEIFGLAATPDSASATVVVTAARGASTEVRYQQDEPEGCRGVGQVVLDVHPGDALRAAALGEMPFTYDVDLVMDGSLFRASASWPADEFPRSSRICPAQLRTGPPRPDPQGSRPDALLILSQSPGTLRRGADRRELLCQTLRNVRRCT